jgi:hypothetical protein
MLTKPSKRTVNIMELTRQPELNVRLLNNYDLASMKASIIDAGRILKPIICELVGKLLVVLSGNRRAWAGQELYETPGITAELKEALSKVDVIVYEKLTDQERLRLILDHGGEKPISRAELVQSCWRLAAQMYNENEIIRQMYFAIAKYTGNERKLRELPPESDPQARQKALQKWLHGTVGNYILRAATLGAYVREQFFLTHKAEDGLLETEKGEKVEMRLNRDRMKALSEAKTADEKAGGWSTEKGGKTFNELIGTYKTEDATGVVADKPSRPTVKQLEQQADAYQSDIAKFLCKRAAGHDVTENLADLDTEAFRIQKIVRVLTNRLDTSIPKGMHQMNVHELLSVIAFEKAEKVESYLDNIFPPRKS